MKKFFWGFVAGAVVIGPGIDIGTKVALRHYTGNWPGVGE